LRQNYITGHSKKLRSLVFNPKNSRLLGTCALDGYVKVWHLAPDGRSYVLRSGSIPHVAHFVTHPYSGRFVNWHR